MFNEKEFKLRMQDKIIDEFYKELHIQEQSFHMQLCAQGWKYIRTNKRTVIFSFGEVTINRRCYTKNGENRYPIDEYLGLKKHARYSVEFLSEVATIATNVPYRQAANIFEKLKGVFITKDTVLKAVQYATQLYQQKDEYESLAVKEEGKRKVDVLYIEGDGVILKANNGEQSHKDLSHFIIHEGVETEYGNRKKLIEKHEFIDSSNRDVRQKVLDFIYTYYSLDKNTLVITNSDMGVGYTPFVFKELVSQYGVKHEHFWDVFHLNKEIKNISNMINNAELGEHLYNSIQKHDKTLTKNILEEMENFLSEENKENFYTFKKRLLSYYQYTKPIEKRGISDGAIGIIESQHTKITNRMKKRKMYWSVEGATTMARMIIDLGEGNLRNLFFGEWKNEFELLEERTASAKKYLKNIKEESTIPEAQIQRASVAKIVNNLMSI